MAIRFYCDEHIHPAITNALRRRGVDILTAQEADMLGVPDEKHLQYATSQERVILTQDADFLRIHKTGTPHHGIVYAPQSTPTGEMIQGLILIYQVLTEEEMKNRVEYI
jgi:predicted nuclease of predicted toxin-antitoxin system